MKVKNSICKAVEKNMPVFDLDEAKKYKYIILKVKRNSVEYFGNIFEATRWRWKMNKKRAEKHSIVLGVVHGIVEGVFQPKEWFICSETKRLYFKESEIVSKEIIGLFLNRRIPDIYSERGANNPVRYSKQAALWA